MNMYEKIRRICRPIRIIVGIVLITIGVIIQNPWFFLGVIPLLAGVVNFCPLCSITKKCSIK